MQGRSARDSVAAWGWRPGPLARALTSFGVPYATIGGVAVATYAGSRRPGDLDIVIAPTESADRRATRAVRYLVRRWGLADRSQGVIFCEDDFSEQTEVIVPTRIGKLHIVGKRLPAYIDVTGVVARRKWLLLDRAPLAVCSLEDLVAIKRANAGDKDLRDLRLLQR